ncbi:MAG: recombination protein RecR [Candidatus Abyssobacteria bacterium SURF_5]|uniref:Recombination protein RecR n=1 Tax=Abyssobacteria bacterium (strain SURF_5) TaxID=2093360 RepID=A0A3A4P3Z6_ABYX5|nr:MAG: recombination protein RecR [Candidatus Abyssubacteria bacterium SURF_5]
MKTEGGAIARLVEEFRRLPGIGPKSAQRLAFYIINLGRDEATRLAQAIIDAKERVRLCSVCCNITESDPCAICSDERRDRSIICVVEKPSDAASIERGGKFRGLFHVLHGSISPLDGVGPDQIRLKELLMRITPQSVSEVIVATNPNTSGEATAMYIREMLKPLNVRVTRIAQGVPVGSDLEFADNSTLSHALEGRREM